MKMIQPITMTDGQLTASNVTENDHAAWDESASYDTGDRVIVTAVHKVYESVSDANLGNDPTAAASVGTWWVEVGATNRWKAFDSKIADQVSKSGTITYTITPTTTVTAIGFLGVDAAEIRVRILDTGASVILDETRSLVDSTEIVDWFTYFTFDPSLEYETESLFIGVPGYAGDDIEITIGDGIGTAKVGQIILGKLVTLGRTLEGTSIGIRDFSTKDRDAFGNPILVERAFIDETSFTFTIPAADERRVKRELAAYRAKPALYFADENAVARGATVYGYFQDFTIPLAAAGRSTATLEIEGLT